MAFNSVRNKNEGGIYRNTSCLKRILVYFETELDRLRAIRNTHIPVVAMPQINQVFNSQLCPMHIINCNKMHVLPRILFIDDNNGNLTAVKDPGRAIK